MSSDPTAIDSDPPCSFRRLRRDEYEPVQQLLTGAGLPTADLHSAPVELWVMEGGDGLLATGGIEAYGDQGLLRSMVVRETARGSGLGGALLGALEAAACERGMRRLWLLTTTAERYFAARGFRVVDRASAPASLQASAEFRDLCPASAVCMVKPLPPPDNADAGA